MKKNFAGRGLPHQRTYIDSIPQQIQSKLEMVFNVDKLSNIHGSSLTKCCRDINIRVKNIYEENREALSRYFSPSEDSVYPFFSRKSLERYFSGDRIRSDKMYVILSFLDYTPDQFQAALEENDTSNQSAKWFINGFWTVYVYDSAEPSVNKVKRTPVFFQKKKGNEEIYNVQYKSVWEIFFSGTASIASNSLILDLTDNEKTRLFFTLYLPDLKYTSDTSPVILNGACLSNGHGGRIVTADMVFTKNSTTFTDENNYAIKQYLQDSPVTSIVFQDANEQEQNIARYLSRSSHRDNTVKPFVPNSFFHVNNRNIEFDKRAGTSNYDKLKLRLNLHGHSFYSFNRYRPDVNEVAVYRYSFEFNDAERICKVIRHPLNETNKPELEGFVFLEGEKVYFEMRDHNLQRRKQLIAPFNSTGFKSDSSPEGFRSYIFLGITSSVRLIDAKHLALREIIVCLTPKGTAELLELLSHEDNINGFIDYRKFCSINESILRDDEKLFIANPSVSVLSFPSENNPRYIHSRMDKARRYLGVYHLFIAAPKGRQSKKLLKIIMVIDRLSQVTLIIRYSDSKRFDNVSYLGSCEFFNQNLHISTQLQGSHPTEQKYADLIVDYIKEKRGLEIKQFKGKMLTTDDESNAVGYNFIAIKIMEGNTYLKSDYSWEKEEITCNLEYLTSKYPTSLNTLQIENPATYFKQL